MLQLVKSQNDVESGKDLIGRNGEEFKDQIIPIPDRLKMVFLLKSRKSKNIFKSVTLLQMEKLEETLNAVKALVLENANLLKVSGNKSMVLILLYQ